MRDQGALVADSDGHSKLSELHIRHLAFEVDPIPMVMVDFTGIAIGMNERARSLFGIAVTDAGHKLQDLELSYRPVELRSLIDQAYGEPPRVVAGGRVAG